MDAGDYYIAAAKDAHAAVNNILAAKGKTAADGAGATYFTIASASGTINLDEGINVIEITKSGGNPDYLNIRTSATLVDNTVPFWSGEYVPSFEVSTGPTGTSRGELTVFCPDADCSKGGSRVFNYGSLPELGDDCYIYQNGAYYIELFGQLIQVA